MRTPFAFSLAGVISGFFVLMCPAAANTLLMRGKVVMEDGSIPNRSVRIERFCHDTGGQGVAQTDKKGNYLWTMEIDPLSDKTCVLRAGIAGFDSTVIDISAFNWSTDPNLPPPMVIRPRAAGSSNTDLLQHFLRGRNSAGRAHRLEQCAKTHPEEELGGSRAGTANRGTGRAEVHPRLECARRGLLQPE